MVYLKIIEFFFKGDKMEKKTILIAPKYKKSQKKILELNEKYKSINKLKLDVSGYTVLIGENASGKTNILDWIYGEQGNYIDSEDLVEQFGKMFFEIFNRKSPGYKIENEYKFLASGTNNLEIYLEFFDENEDFVISGNNGTLKIPLKTTYDSYKGKKIEEKQKIFKEKYQQYFGFEVRKNNFFTLLFSFPKYNMNNLEEIVDDYLKKILEIEVLSKGNNTQSVFKILSILPQINDNINDALMEKLNLKKDGSLLKINLQLDTEETENSIRVNKFKIFVIDEAEGTVFPLKYKSAGLNNIISVVIIVEFLKYLITKYPKYNELRFLIAIDEPELHLHPYIQSKLTNYFYRVTNEEFKNKINVIVATHSQNMLWLDTLEKVYIVNYIKDKGTTATKLLDYRTSEVTDINVLKPIEDALGTTFNEFRLPMLIVEGEEEVALFRRVSGIFNEFSNIKCIKGKTNIAPYLIMINKYKDEQENSIILLDADVEQKDIKSVEKLREVLEGLKERIFFVGKEIYTYDEYLNGNTGLKKKGRFGETLEDFLIEKVLGREKYKEIVKEIFIEVNFQEIQDVGDSFFELRDSILLKCLRDNRLRVDEMIKEKLRKEIFELEPNDYERWKVKVKDLVFNKIKVKINSIVQSEEKYGKFDEEIKGYFNW